MRLGRVQTPKMRSTICLLSAAFTPRFNIAPTNRLATFRNIELGAVFWERAFAREAVRSGLCPNSVSLKPVGHPYSASYFAEYFDNFSLRVGERGLDRHALRAMLSLQHGTARMKRVQVDGLHHLLSIATIRGLGLSSKASCKTFVRRAWRSGIHAA